ncbi:MAG: hypothetical protein MJE77_38065 [Proteobacteria bacterium]|nr:hypothetical protein [Pseudomonadota bacterium]
MASRKSPFRSEAAVASIDVMATDYPQICTDAGTVLSAEKLQSAIDGSATRLHVKE